MAIAKMKKFTLLTFAAYKETLLKELQKFGDVHFRKLEPDDAEITLDSDISMKTIERYEQELEKVKFVLSKIEPFVRKPKGLKALTAQPVSMGFEEFEKYTATYDFEPVYEKVKAEEEALNATKAAITKLKADNENLRLWLGLDVSSDELESLKYAKCLVGTVNKLAADNFKLNAGEGIDAFYMELLGNVKDDVAVLAIVPAEEYEAALANFKELGFTRLSLSFNGVPSELIEENNLKIAGYEESLKAAAEKIGEFAGEYERLQIAHDYYQAVLDREWTRGNFLQTETAVLMEGWVPEDDADKFRKIIADVCGNNFYIEEEDVPRDSQDVPIKLRNNKFFTAFEGITETFSMPKYNQLDPTPLFAPFYFLFFGFMLGDAGYGLILILAAWLVLKFCNINDGTRRFLKFFYYLGFATFFAGLVYGSAFGQTFPFLTPLPVIDPATGLQMVDPENGKLVYKAILDSQLDVVTMMILSVAIGFLQILFGLAIKMYVLARNGDLFAAVFDAGFWLLTVAAGVFWLLGIVGVIPPMASTVSCWLFWIGIFGLAATQGRESKTVPTKIISGIYSVYGITSYVGDLVSYTRIAALALSGAYIAFAFNIMSNLFPAGPVRWIFGTLVYLFGLFLNLGLSALGAYVHTMRLQYVEFFGKFYDGGGVPFNPFKLKNKFININEK